MGVIDTNMTTSTAPKPSPFDHFVGEPEPETYDGRDRYDVGGVQAEKVIAHVMDSLLTEVDDAEPVWDVANALKYLLRIGSKDPWTIEAHKAENYLHHARTGRWLD